MRAKLEKFAEPAEVLAEIFGTKAERIHVWSDDSMTIGDCDTIDYYVVPQGDEVDGYNKICTYTASNEETYTLYANTQF